MIWNFCIRRPVLTIVVFLVIGIFGGYSFLGLPIQENPDVDFPVVSITVVLPGAAPEVIEHEVIEPLEGEINTIEGLKTLTSSAREQVGTIIAEFELWRDIDIAAQDVRDAIERSRWLLPTDAESPVVRKLDLQAQAIMWIALVGDQRWDDVRITEYAETVLKRRLESLRGVGQIQVGGRRKYAIRVRLDPEKLAAHHLTVHDVVQAIQSNNVDIPSGRIEGARREFLIKTQGQFNSAAPMNELIVAHHNGAAIRLADVGEAIDGIEDDRQLARFSGEPAVGLGIVKQTDANTVAVADLVRQRMDHFAAEFPPGLQYHIAGDTSTYIRESISDLIRTIAIAASLVVLVVMGFLRSGRGTIVTSLAIPTSLLAGLFMIYLMGFSLNVLTMLGLILVIGIVVDDAIVVLERAYHHMENGAEAKPAARIGTTEVAFPAIANTLALAAVFIPVAFTGGLIGRFFMEFGLTIAVTVFASTMVALTLTPMLCSRLLKVPEKHGRCFGWTERMFCHVENGYSWLLAKAFGHRLVTLAVGVGAFVVGIAAFTGLSKEFAPAEDRERFLLIFETPEGATLAETDAYAAQIEQVLAQTPEVANQFLAIGLSMGGPGRVNSGLAFVSLTPRRQRELHQEQVMQNVRQQLAALSAGQAFVVELTPGNMGGSPIQVVLRHSDLNQLAEQQDRIMDWMRAQGDYVGVRSNLTINRPQIDVIPNREMALERGISVADISNTLRFLLAEPAISRIERGGERYDIITESLGRGDLTAGVLDNLYLRASDGSLVAMSSLVDYEETIAPAEINRHSRMRSATVSAATPPGVTLGDAVEKLEAFLTENLPPGTDYEMAGMSQVFQESFYYLSITLIFAVVFIFLVLSAQFESFLYPLTIMLALPLAAVGAFGSLWALGMTFNIYSFIGLIVLMGLVTKNSILLIDYTNVMRARGLSPIEAARSAARTRLRPVLMTAVSTILGMMPIALAYGAGGEARSPLGVSVAAGLLSATALTLIVVPVVYTLFDQLQTWLLGLVRTSRQEEQPLRLERYPVASEI